MLSTFPNSKTFQKIRFWRTGLRVVMRLRKREARVCSIIRNPTHGSGWIVQIQPTPDRLFDLTNPTNGRDSYENRFGLNQIDHSSSIFMPGGESRFMIYCVKTRVLPQSLPWVGFLSLPRPMSDHIQISVMNSRSQANNLRAQSLMSLH